MKNWLMTILTGFLLLVFSSKSAAITLSVCFEDWEPHASISPSGLAVGHSIDKLTKLAAHSDIAFKFHQLPYARCVNRVQKKQIDFALHVDASDQLALIRPKFVDWELVFVVHRDSELTHQQILQVPALNVLISRDYSYPKAVLQKLARAQLKLNKASFDSANPEKIRRLFAILTSGRVDAMLVDKQWAQAVIDEYRFEVKVLENLLHVEPQFIGYHPDNKIKAAYLKRVLSALN